MAIEVTYHGRRAFDQADLIDALPPQVDGPPGTMFAVADGAVSAEVGHAGLYRVYAVSECRVRAGNGIANANGGMRLDAGAVDIWWLAAGTKIACAALGG